MLSSSSLPLSLLPLPPTHCLSPSFLLILLTTFPSFLSILFLTTYLPHSFPSSSSLPLSLLLPILYFSPSLLSSSSLPLSLLPLPPTHCLSPSFLLILLLTTFPSFLSILFLTTYLPHSFPSSSSLPLSLLLPLLYFSPSLLSSSSLSLSLLALPPTHCLSPSFLIATSLPSFLSIHFLTTSPSFFSILLLTCSLPPSSVILTAALLPSSVILTVALLPSSLSSSSLPLSLIPIPPPDYLSPSFLSLLLTTSPSFLSVILITSPSFIPLNPPPHYLSSLSCNIIIHLITSVFLPSPSSLLTLPHCISPSFFSILFLITFSVYFTPPSSSSSSLLLLSSFTFVTSSFLSSSFKSPLHYLLHYFLIIILLIISILFHIDSLPNSSPSSSLFYTSISPSSPSSFYHSPPVLSILLFIFLPSHPLPHTCQS